MNVEETGFAKVAVAGHEIEVDVYDVYNRLVEIRDAHAESVRGRNQATVDLMTELGWERVSHRTAILFTNAMFRAVEDLEKKGGSAGSPPPTAD
jgi:hypothetical protein